MLDTDRIQRTVRAVLEDHAIRGGEVSVAVVDDPTIRQLNCRHLQHDYATDVLSFLLDRKDGCLEGEVIVSGDTACRVASEYGWPADDELLLYIVHGTLHLVGYEDGSDAERAQMREREGYYLRQLGISPPASLPPNESAKSESC